MPRRIIIVGCGVAGTTAAFYARKTDRSARIIIVGDEPLAEYSRCGLPYAFSGIVPSLESLVGYDDEFYRHTNRIDLRLSSKVESIDPENKTVVIQDLYQKQFSTEEYDSLILATGAHPLSVPVNGTDLKGVFTIRTMDDVHRLADHLRSSNAKRVAIIGAGLTGSEMSEALLIRKISVIQAEIVPEILPAILDPDMASIIREQGMSHGVEYHLASTLEEVLGKNGFVIGVRISGETYSVDAVVIAVRVKPNVELASSIGIKLGQFGGIRTDDGMATSIHDIFAVGDCVETYDLITHRHVLYQLATTAVHQAMVAGTNAAGGNMRYAGSTGVSTVKLFGYEIASFGPTTASLEKIGIKPVSVRITASTRLSYFPAGKDLTVKLLADSTTGRILAAQLIGEEGATLRVNFASMAGHLGLTVEQFSQIETCYSPPVAPVWDPLTIAAQALLRKLKPTPTLEKSLTNPGIS